MGLFDINIPHDGSSMRIEIKTENFDARIGIVRFEVNVGTCPRDCLKCKSPT